MILGEIERGSYFVKCLLTRDRAVFFPATLQHRDVKMDGISYEDDYRGNALAATVVHGRIDIRFHSAYSDEAVATIVQGLLAQPDMAWATGFTATYQGRSISGT